MTNSVKIARDRQGATDRPLLAIAGSMLALFGAALAIGGAFITSDGAFFYIFAGFGLIASGGLLAKRHWAGAWTYAAVFAATLFWSLQDSHLGGSPLAYRLVGPIILAVLMAIVMPIIGRRSRARTINMCAAMIVATIIFGIFASDVADPVDRLAIAHLKLPENRNGALQ